MFLKEKRENVSVLPRRELSILLRFSNLGRDGNPYGFSQFRYLRQNLKESVRHNLIGLPRSPRSLTQSIILSQPVHLVQFMLSGLLLVALVLLPVLSTLLLEPRIEALQRLCGGGAPQLPGVIPWRIQLERSNPLPAIPLNLGPSTACHNQETSKEYYCSHEVALL